MNLSFEVPKEVLLINRADLKETLREMISEMQVELSVDEVMTIKETAEYLKVSVPTVRSLIANKDIPFFQRGQVIRLSKWQVLEWMRFYNSSTNQVKEKKFERV